MMNKIIKELFTSFIGNIAQDLVINGMPTGQVINDYAMQFAQAIVGELQKDKEVVLSDSQRDELEGRIAKKMAFIVRDIFGILDKSKDKVYKEYQINPKLPLADAVIVMQEKLKVNLIAKMVEKSGLQDERSDFEKFIEKILEVLHLKQPHLQNKLQSVFKSSDKSFVNMIKERGNSQLPSR